MGFAGKGRIRIGLLRGELTDGDAGVEEVPLKLVLELLLSGSDSAGEVGYNGFLRFADDGSGVNRVDE